MSIGIFVKISFGAKEGLVLLPQAPAREDAMKTPVQDVDFEDADIRRFALEMGEATAKCLGVSQGTLSAWRAHETRGTYAAAE